MKKTTLLVISVLALVLLSSFVTKETPVAKDIDWLTFEEAVKKNDSEKRYILIDVYTDWCGWCKVMDRETFTDSKVKAHLDKNFHVVKLDAEQKEEIKFKGNSFKWVKAGRNGIHQLAYSLLGGEMSYPTLVILNDKFQRVEVVKGFKRPNELYSILEKYKK